MKQFIQQIYFFYFNRSSQLPTQKLSSLLRWWKKLRCRPLQQQRQTLQQQWQPQKLQQRQRLLLRKLPQLMCCCGRVTLSVFLLGCFGAPTLYAARILVEDNVKIGDDSPDQSNSSRSSSNPLPSRLPRVGRAAAQKYFVKDAQDDDDGGANSRLLSLHIGGYLKSKAHQWGSQATSEQVGVQTMGVTYKIGEWVRSMDLNLRIDYFQYEVDKEKPIKVSFLPLLTFPDAATDFPLYFGMGLGGGFFLKQMERESNLSIDYQLVFGIRWTDLWNRSGFFIESGIKDHIHLLSDGQFSSQFLTAGAVFKL